MELRSKRIGRMAFVISGQNRLLCKYTLMSNYACHVVFQPRAVDWSLGYARWDDIGWVICRFTPHSILRCLWRPLLLYVPELEARQYIWPNGVRRHTMDWDGRFVCCMIHFPRCKRCFACLPFSSALVLLSFPCDCKVRKY